MALSSLAPGIEFTARMINWGMRDAAIAAALRVDVADAPDLELADLLTKLAVASPQLSASWTALREKCDAWIEFEGRVEAAGGANPLSPDESGQHAKVNSELEQARNAFVGMLRAPVR